MSWKIPRIWVGGECWIIGGGPSMPRQFGVPEQLIQDVHLKGTPASAFSPYLSPIHTKHVIGVNSAYLLGTWIDLLLFGDNKFYWRRVKEMREFPKPIICCNSNMFKEGNREGVFYLPQDKRHQYGLTRRPDYVSWNLNTGAAAINLAYHLGAIKIYLLGFDMYVGKYGNQHWHRNYAKPNTEVTPHKAQRTFNRHLKGMRQIQKDAKTLGIEIYNISPDSKIDAFAKKTLNEVL